MHKIIKIVLVVLSLVGAGLWFGLPSAELSEANPAEAAKNGAMNFMFILTYLFLGIAVIVSLFFTLRNLFSTSGNIKKALFSIGGLLLVVAISYGLASGTDVDINEMASKGIETSESTIKAIGMGLNVFLILTVVAILSMVLPGIKNLFSK